MRELTIKEMELTQGAALPLAPLVVRGAIGAASGTAAYFTASSIQGQPVTFSGAAAAAVTGAFTGGGPSAFRTGVMGGIAGGIAGSAASAYGQDGTDYGDGTEY